MGQLCFTMKHGICALSIVPVRAEASDKSELVSQLLFGDLYKVVENRKKWLRIRMQYDGYEGWIDRNQHNAIDEKTFVDLENAATAYVYDTVNMLAINGDDSHSIILQGSTLYHPNNSTYWWFNKRIKSAGQVISQPQSKEKLVEIAFTYLNAPYLWGGRNPFGIDCSGFSQIVYKLGGHKIPRDAKDQALLGEPLSFIEEAEPGDLAFFDNAEGLIVHVGILLENNFIIHASGKVRLDRLDQHGIYNAETREHTHRLRVIKKIF